MEKITGELVAQRIFGNDFWAIATIRTAKDLSTAVGKFLGAELGDSVELEGEWTKHPKFGKQFKVSACRVSIPKTDNGVIAWLATRLPNVGKGRAKAMLDHFGGAEALWQVVEKTPERLAEVKGITLPRAAEISDVYRRFRGERDRMIRLRRWGLTTNQIARVLAVWGDEAEEKIKANPYELAEHIDGFGFLRADAIAQRMGVARDCVARIECGLHHTMAQASGHGHCFVATGKLVKICAAKVLRLDPDVVARELAKMKARGEFVQHGARTFSRSLDMHERRCADAVRRLLGARRAS